MLYEVRRVNYPDTSVLPVASLENNKLCTINLLITQEFQVPDIHSSDYTLGAKTF